MAELTCHTAPGRTFGSMEEMKAHYKTDWHRYNLKRKVAGLPPLPKEQFEARKQAALAARAEKEAGIGKQDHVKDGKKDKAAARRRQRSANAAAAVDATTPPPTGMAEDAMATPPPPGPAGGGDIARRAG